MSGPPDGPHPAVPPVTPAPRSRHRSRSGGGRAGGWSTAAAIGRFVVDVAPIVIGATLLTAIVVLVVVSTFV